MVTMQGPEAVLQSERIAAGLTPQLRGEAPPTILLVENNDDLRYVTDLLLTSLGYRVRACRDGEIALADFRSDCCVDLLLTDIEMPGCDGVELARRLTHERPLLPVMIVSGSTLSAALAQEMRDRDWIFLSKPYALPALLSSVESLLSALQSQAA